ncbi:MAG: galactose ABC transporter substrate-binding protein [Eubacteriaceae bacterium]|nr:galactose ABC transporter substrate-binding protein [Eubacteriaceae bacterium]
MKKVLALLVAVLLVFSFAACGQQKTEAKTYKVGVTIYKFDDNFMTLYRNEMEAYFKSLETDAVKYDVTIMDAANDMATQVEQVNTFIAQGVDVLIVNLVQTSSAEQVTNLVQEAGIPCVLINREPAEEFIGENMCYVGADARQSGTYQGEIVAELENHGDINGDGVVKYIMIMGDPENTDAQYRTEYSVKALVDAGIKVEELFKQTGNWDQAEGQELVATALANFGNDIEVVFCNNDAMALGAYQAVKGAGRTVGTDIYLLGVDALTECCQMVLDGTMTGTVLNDHIAQSHAAVDAAIAYLNGETVEKYIWANYTKVTAENAQEILDILQ